VTKQDLKDHVVAALRARGGGGSVVDVCQYIWSNYRRDLEASGDLFYTWQYDVRWAAYELRREGVLKTVEDSPRGIWELT
jgi:hypothetical protein